MVKLGVCRPQKHPITTHLKLRLKKLVYCNAVAAASLKLANRTTRSLTGLPDVSCSHPAPISGSYSSGRSSYSSDHSRIKGSPHLAVGASESLSFTHTLVRLVEYTLIHTSSLVTWWRFKVRPSKK
jgi:hypothetical protein